jgi:CubicO group peptidase (beta-lactamase class C family)
MKSPSHANVPRALFAGLLTIATTAPCGAADWTARHGLSPAEYQAAFNSLGAQGFRPLQVCGYESNGKEKYAALWIKSAAPPWTARHGLTAAEYQKAFDDNAKQGFRLVYVNGYEISGSPRFAAVWEKKTGPALVAQHGLTSAQYQASFTKLTGEGYRLLHVSGYPQGGTAHFAAIFEKSSGPARVARHDLTAADYQKAFDDFTGQGYRLKEVCGYHTGSADRYAAIWEKTGGPPWEARNGVPESFYQNIFDNAYYKGDRPVFLNAFSSGTQGRFNVVWENDHFKAADLSLIATKANDYLKNHNAPGVSIAIAKDGRLVFAQGFGLADQGSGEPVGPLSRFRIASVSKTLTSVTVMRLVEKHKLSLDDKVFGPGSKLGATFPTPAAYPRLNDITVRELLQHVAGLSTAAGGDPMFEHTDYDQKTLITWALANGVLGHKPGSVYEYSNFGFCLLGRVIEKVTGLPYETAVKNEVLIPVGVTDMEIGANSPGERKPYEVVYYPSSAYDLNVTRFDAHGGWIGTPIDLLRFLVKVDGSPTKPDIISAATHKTMTTKSGVKDAKGNDNTYALGWEVGGNTQQHNGAMSGTIAQLIHLPNGWSFAAVVNTRPGNDTFAGDLAGMLNEIISGVSAWPSYDLF